MRGLPIYDAHTPVDVKDERAPAARRRFPLLLAPSSPRLPPRQSCRTSEEISAATAHRQRRVLFSTIVGYSAFYFVRKNLSVAMPGLQTDLGISKGDPAVLTLHGVLYGVSKFANGFLGDRTNARVFMAARLVLSAIANVFFGLSSAVVTLGLILDAQRLGAGDGVSPVRGLMAHWFSPKELATKFSI